MSTDRLNPILDAIVTHAGSLELSLSGHALPVLKRKAPTRQQKLDPPEMVTVSKSATPEQVSRRRFGLWQTAYVIDVTVVCPYTGPDSKIPEYALMRDRLVDLFKKPPLPGAPEVFELNAQPADWLRPFGEQTDYDWQSLQVTATVAHS